MKTRRNKLVKNKTIKKNSMKPSFKILKKGYPLYASKQYEGSGKTSREVLKNLGLLWRQKKLSREE